MTLRLLEVEPRWIEAPALLAIHAQQVERYGGGHGVLYPQVVLSTLARVRRRWEERESTDLADLAAMYLVGFARSGGFSDANKRTGLACALVFLAINGIRLSTLAGGMYNVVREVANGKGDDMTVAAWFRSIIPQASAGIAPIARPPVVRCVRESSLI